MTPDPNTKKVLADTIIGVNTRKKDNIFQGIFVLVSIGLGTLAGFLFSLTEKDSDLLFSLVLGGISGLFTGFF